MSEKHWRDVLGIGHDLEANPSFIAQMYGLSMLGNRSAVEKSELRRALSEAFNDFAGADSELFQVKSDLLKLWELLTLYEKHVSLPKHLRAGRLLQEMEERHSLEEFGRQLKTDTEKKIYVYKDANQ